MGLKNRVRLHVADELYNVCQDFIRRRCRFLMPDNSARIGEPIATLAILANHITIK